MEASGALTAHLAPRAAAEVIRAISPGTRTLVAVAQYSPAPNDVERVAVIDVGLRPREKLTAWMTPPEIAMLADALGALRGETDAMYATHWKLAWTAGPPFCLWDRRGPRAWVEADRLRLGRDTVDARAVEGYLGRGWVERGVRLVLASGERRLIARQREWAAMLDVTYDGLDVMGDAAWVVSLARALGDALHVPADLDPAL